MPIDHGENIGFYAAHVDFSYHTCSCAVATYSGVRSRWLNLALSSIALMFLLNRADFAVIQIIPVIERL